MRPKLVLTHPEPRNTRVAEHLRAHGVDVVALPTRRLVPLGSEAFGPGHPLTRISEYRWVIPVSPGAVEAALAQRAPAWPAATGLAAVGPGTAAALASVGLAPPAVRVVSPASPPYDADALLALPAFACGGGARVLVLRGASGRDAWVETLRARGFEVDVVQAYRVEAIAPAAGERARLQAWAEAGARAAFAFSSVDAIDATLQLLSDPDTRAWSLRQRALVLHARHAAHLARIGWQCAARVAPGERALVQALESA